MLNAVAYCASTSTVSAGQQANGQVADACNTVYGSDDRGQRATSAVQQRYSNLHALRPPSTTNRTLAGLHGLSVSRGVPVVCIQVVKLEP